MKRPILLALPALLALALASAPARAFLHGHPLPPVPGGPGPGGATPPGTGPSSPTPSGPGPGTGTPQGPAAPRPSTPGSTPNGAPAGTGGAGGPQTGGDARWLDPTWDLWWHFHKEEFLELKRRVHEGGLGTEGLGRGGGLAPAAASGYRPSAEQIVRDAVPLLVEVLGKERNSELVTSALLAAGRVGELPGASASARFGPLCARLLRDPNQEIAEIAALALGVLGAEENLPLLVSLLHDDARGRDAAGAREVPLRTRSFAAYGLGVLAQHTRSNRTRQMIARALTDELARREGCATDTRAACVVALALVPLELERAESASAPWISRQTELRFLLQFASEPETRPLLVAHAATSLAELAADSTPEAKQVADDFLIALLRRESSEAALRESCLMGLGRLADDDQDPEDRRTRAELRRTLVSGSTSERAFALMSLSEAAARHGLGVEQGSALGECREVLLEELARGKSRSRSWAALALGVLEFRLQHQGAEPALAVHEALRRALAGAAGPDEAGACAVAIGLAGDAEGALSLGERLAGPGDDVLRGYFALGIGLSGNRTLAQGVRAVSAGARYRPFLLQQCAIALALLGDKNLAPELTSELRTATGQASQSWLAQALGMVGDSRSVPVLVEMVRDRGLTDAARGNLTSALGIVCDKDELPWYHALSSRVNWRAATSTLIAGNGTGVLEIL
jgi:HEAT repeat protein